MSRDEIEVIIGRWHGELMETKVPRRIADIQEIIAFWEALLRAPR